MQKIEFQVKERKELIKAIIDELPFLSRFDVGKILENKDCKVNNVRTKDNIGLSPNDNITVFYQEKEQKEWYVVVYEDDNILIINKRAGIEVVSEKERDLTSILRKNHETIFPVHRIDRNTEGLVIFAKNQIAEKELLSAFKSRNGIIKKYALMVQGRVDPNKIKRTVYLKKFDNLSKVWISELKSTGYEKIITDFEVIKYFDDKTLLEATLITGKTHQIRAHIAYFGYPIVGDNKYGNSNEKVLHLTANFLKFDFNKNSILSYLNGKSFEIAPTWIS
ncbi:MAG: RluA family pseudouridine synthase [Candidatus Onthoplasma sp.]